MQAFFVRADDRLNARWGQLVRRLPREIYLDVYWTIKFQGPLSRVGWNLTESATRVEIFGYPLWKEYFEREKERERKRRVIRAVLRSNKDPVTSYLIFHVSSSKIRKSLKIILYPTRRIIHTIAPPSKLLKLERKYQFRNRDKKRRKKKKGSMLLEFHTIRKQVSPKGYKFDEIFSFKATR